MAGVKVTIKGQSNLRKKLGRLADDVNKPIRQAMALGALQIQTDAVRSLKGPRSGAVRPTGGRSSAPGEPPKWDTGRLAGSIFAEVRDKGRDRVEAVVGTDLDYGKFLELGTKKLSPRPWLFPALERNKDRFVRRVMKAAAEAAKKSPRKN